MKKPTIEQHTSHIIVKCLDKKIDIQEVQEYFNKKELGITLYIAAYEIGRHSDKHIHAYSSTLYTKRYYQDHLKHPEWKFRLKFIEDTLEDKKKVISYIFKDGDDYHEYSKKKFFMDYRENKDCSFHNMNIYNIYHDAKVRKERKLAPNPSQTEYWISHFKKQNPKPEKKEILKEIIKYKKEKFQEITKLRLKNLLQTILVNIDPKYEKYIINEIADEI